MNNQYLLNPLQKHVNDLDIEIATYRKALKAIAKGEGRFSLDPLTHAGNTIEDMKYLAQSALDDYSGGE